MCNILFILLTSKHQNLNRRMVMLILAQFGGKYCWWRGSYGLQTTAKVKTKLTRLCTDPVKHRETAHYNSESNSGYQILATSCSTNGMYVVSTWARRLLNLEYYSNGKISTYPAGNGRKLSFNHQQSIPKHKIRVLGRNLGVENQVKIRNSYPRVGT